MYSNATIKRARTILRNAETAQAITRKSQQNNPRTSTTRNAVKADWRTRPASDAQIARIHRCERDLGYKLSNRATIGNAGQASDLYQSLKAELLSL
jgi:hypothetical protein